MENIPEVKEEFDLPVVIDIFPYMLDHRVEGRVVLPGVEAMQVLAQCVREICPGSSVTCLKEVVFDKFLYIDPDSSSIDASCHVKVLENGDISASLITRTRSKKAGIIRTKRHAAVVFPGDTGENPTLPLDLAASLEGVCLHIPSERVYRELVRFGPSYRNLIETVHLSEDGAVARVRAPTIPLKKDCPLGSPFPVDAAFHAACIWAQRYNKTVAFPVGLGKRLVLKKTVPGNTYETRVFSLGNKGGVYLFDIWILDRTGEIFEYLSKVRMRDVSSGRLVPPDWIIADGRRDLPHVREVCTDLVTVELGSLASFAKETLSPAEQKRFARMGERRRPSYLAARISCKRLSRRLYRMDRDVPADMITTVCEDGILPCCPDSEGKTHYRCSVSHDVRFAVAAASSGRIGIDVEMESERLLGVERLYMTETEREMTRYSPLGHMQAALRVWSVKEGVAKAMGISLADAWNRARVTRLGHHRSEVVIYPPQAPDSVDTRPVKYQPGMVRGEAIHDSVGQHLFTILLLKE